MEEVQLLQLALTDEVSNSGRRLPSLQHGRASLRCPPHPCRPAPVPPCQGGECRWVLDQVDGSSNCMLGRRGREPEKARRDPTLAAATLPCQCLAATLSNRLWELHCEKVGPSSSSSFALGLLHPTRSQQQAQTVQPPFIPQWCSPGIPWDLQWDVMADGRWQGQRPQENAACDAQHLGAVSSCQPPALLSLPRLRSWSSQGL